VALPGAVARTLGLVDGLRLEAVLVLADAQSVRQRAADVYVGDTVRQQLLDADWRLLTKADLVDAASLAETRDWLVALAGPRVLPVDSTHIDAASLLGLPRQPASRVNELRGAQALALPAGHAAGRMFESLSLEFDHAVRLAQLAQALSAPELGLLRAKGLVHDGAGQRQVLQLVGARCTLSEAPGRPGALGRLVCIGLRGRFDAAAVRRIVDDVAA
jgi:G3E family GTPase